MSEISDRLIALKSRLPGNVRLVAVSKTMPAEDILEAYKAGQRIFGENRVQEILAKKDILPPDIEWHMIGHLQTNKVKQVVPVASMIHSADSLKLLSAINSESAKTGKATRCLLQVHIAEEETKSGFSEEELVTAVEGDEFRNMKNVIVCGLMGMATFTDDAHQVRREFRSLAELFKKLKAGVFRESNDFRELSMGMSGDFEIAVSEGSTMVRIGSLIFGERNKNE